MNTVIRNITTRQAAKEQSEKFYFTGIACIRNHISKRYTSTNQCVTCVSERDKRRYVEDSIEFKKRASKYRISHPGYRTKIMRRWRIEKRHLWLVDRSHQNSKRRSITYARNEEIDKIFLEAKQLSEITGIKHHVHHIVPLFSLKNICGLHVPHNLIILTEDEHKWYHKKKKRIKTLWY